METYRGYKVQSEIYARLVPFTEEFYECNCLVVLTNSFVAVLEDNFNGDYDCVIEIPISKVISIEKFIPNSAKEGGSLSYGSKLGKYVFESVVRLFAGHRRRITPGEKSLGGVEYLKIEYIKENGRSDELMFENCRSSIERICSEFEKLKSS